MESLLARCAETVHRLHGPQEPHGLHNDKNVEPTTSTMVRVTIDIRFKIIHKKGSENAQADALSRRADYREKGSEQSHTLLRQEKDGSLKHDHPEVMTMTKIIVDDYTTEIRNAYPGDKEIQRLRKEKPTNPRIRIRMGRYYGTNSSSYQ